jgi:hypothetical protein
VYFASGLDREAQAVAGVLNLAPTSTQLLPNPPPFDVKGADITVLIGPDLAGASAPATPTTPTSTATTRPAATTTTTTPRPTTTVAHPTTTTTKKP